ncbi:hypothetical protein [Boudabousia marimammalium]|uniref:Uncharacterized protein n=1 Tax=Boudabousia marimammalium TaxID=156892 RepID=A0A1Q5PR70_9ACTO|nr:hypothetical protein [Boudabousia marimammalium]OKL49993.1 hypothetical protein BM477_03615 [Boudabousia marimammalium]
MWTAIWIFLAVAIIVVPTAVAVWALREGLRGLTRVGEALDRLGTHSEAEVPSAVEPYSFSPGVAFSTKDRALVAIRRRQLQKAKLTRRVRSANQALTRWQKIGFFRSVDGDITAELQVRGRSGEQIDA